MIVIPLLILFKSGCTDLCLQKNNRVFNPLFNLKTMTYSKVTLASAHDSNLTGIVHECQ